MMGFQVEVLGLPAARALPKPRTSEWLHSAPTKPLKAKLLPPTTGSTARQPRDQQTTQRQPPSSSHQLTSTSSHNKPQMMSPPPLKNLRFYTFTFVVFSLRVFAIFRF